MQVVQMKENKIINKKKKKKGMNRMKINHNKIRNNNNK